MREKARQIKEREREMREERKAELEVRASGDLSLNYVISLLQDFLRGAFAGTLTNITSYMSTHFGARLSCGS